MNVDGLHSSISTTQPETPSIHYPPILEIIALAYGFRLTTQKHPPRALNWGTVVQQRETSENPFCGQVETSGNNIKVLR